jgi:hypothetical protein
MYRKILSGKMSFNPQGSALLVNQSFALNFCVKIFSQNSLILIQIVNGSLIFYKGTLGNALEGWGVSDLLKI